MSLRLPVVEQQINLYSRQILLKDVGGIGQEKLLDSPVEVRGSSAAIGIAITYLAAGGTPCNAAHPAAYLTELPGELPITLEERSMPWVGMGKFQGEPLVAFKATDACYGCFQAFAEQVSPFASTDPGAEPAVERAVWVGAFTAWVIQKIILGHLTGGGAFRLLGDGQIRSRERPQCHSFPHCLTT